MKKIKLLSFKLIVCTAFVAFTACGPASSPEGRMSIRLEKMHKEMIDSLHRHNRAILDSLSKMREEINALKRQSR